MISADTRYVDGEWSGSYSLKYDLAKDILVMVDESLDGNTKQRESLTLQGNPASARPNGVIADIELSGAEPNYGTWGVKLKVIADDAGGVVDSDYYWDEQTITSFTTSAPTADGAEYVLMPASAGASADYLDSLGYMEGHGTDDETNYVYYYGPAVVPASFKLFHIGLEGADGFPTVTDAGLTATLSVTVDQRHFYYLEEFGPTGNLTYTCSKSVKTLTACEYADGTAGPYVQALQGESFTFGDALIQVTLAGAGANAAALGGETFYVLPGSVDLSVESPLVRGYQLPEALAWGVFYGDPESLSTTGMTGYSIEVFAASSAEFTGARVWRIAYHTTAGREGEPYFLEMTNVAVSAAP